MKRYVLKDIQEHPIRIYGLVCAKPFTQMVWNLGENLEIPFERTADISTEKQSVMNHWPRFKHFDEDMETTFSVVKNKGVDNILAPELKNVDAFLIETNHSLTFQLSLDKISKTSFVDFCFEVTPKMINAETDSLLYID